MQAESVSELFPSDLRKSYILIAEWIGNSQVRNCCFVSATKADVLALWDSGMPRDLLPVFIEKNDKLIDYYCLNLENGPPVVVFCDHAIVKCWDSVDSFIAWITLQTGTTALAIADKCDEQKIASKCSVGWFGLALSLLLALDEFNRSDIKDYEQADSVCGDDGDRSSRLSTSKGYTRHGTTTLIKTLVGRAGSVHFAGFPNRVGRIAAGDATAASERIAFLDGFQMLAVSPDAEQLANDLIRKYGIPPTEPRDALHISIAAVNGIQYLLTWNFRHIANVETRSIIERVCRDNGYTPPLICSPDEMMGL